MFDSELRVMEHHWKDGDLTAGVLARRLAEETGWNRNTTYTVIKKLAGKQLNIFLLVGFSQATCKPGSAN